jgi:hypothetical protein
LLRVDVCGLCRRRRRSEEKKKDTRDVTLRVTSLLLQDYSCISIRYCFQNWQKIYIICMSKCEIVINVKNRIFLCIGIFLQ